MNKDDMCHADGSASGETSSAVPLQSGFGVWLPIETAPNDGRLILVYDERDKPEYAVDLRKADGDFWREYECGPSHWMPLPEPPSSFEEPTTEATPSAQPAEGDHDT